MEIRVNTTFSKVNTEITGKVVKVDNTAKTAIVEFSDGSSKNYSFTSLKDKRRFIMVQEVEEEFTEEENEEIGKEMVEEVKKKSGAKSSITITYNGQTKTPSEWAEEFGMNPKKIRLALRKGKTPDEIFKNN